MAKIMIAPDLGSLLGETKVIRNLQVSGLQITQIGMEKLAALAKSSPGTQRQVAVRVVRVQIENATVQFDKAGIGPFDVKVTLDPRGEPEQLSLALQDGKFDATVKPDAGRYAIEVLAKSWRLPLGPPLVFDELKIKGVATPNDAGSAAYSHGSLVAA